MWLVSGTSGIDDKLSATRCFSVSELCVLLELDTKCCLTFVTSIGVDSVCPVLNTHTETQSQFHPFHLPC